MKKKHARRIKGIAQQMGPKEYTTYEWVPISGEDLLLSGHKVFQGNPIIKDKMYEIRMPVFHSESFEHQLKSAFYKSGDSGIYDTVSTEYIARVNKGVIKHEVSQHE